jgi:hypothetical protein
MKTFRNSAIALTIIGGVALFAVPASANPVTNHQTLFGDSSKSVGVTDVGWRRHYRHWGPPAYYEYGPPAYYRPGLSYYDPGPDFSVGIY